MSDVIISRKGRSGGSGGNLITAYITSNMKYQVPEGIKNNELHVRIFGGGGWSNNWMMGGASGYMNNDVISVTPGEIINITIGEKGGGPTSFGTYLSASGGSESYGGSGGATWNYLTSEGKQFGGGVGSNGGPWGGGGGCRIRWYNSRRCYSYIGHGGTYGGGGGAGFGVYNSELLAIDNAGNGGTYGGGGGASAICNLNIMSLGVWSIAPFTSYRNRVSRFINSGVAGVGGTYGGNGGNGYPNTSLGYIANDIGVTNRIPDLGWYWALQGWDGINSNNQVNFNYASINISEVKSAKEGINTESNSSIPKDMFGIRLNGKGLAGNQDVTEVNGRDFFSGGGGGGYGGNGGLGVYENNILSKMTGNVVVNESYGYYAILDSLAGSGGGGGGYGSNGGDGMIYIWGYNGSNNDFVDILGNGGGGGGYGGDGADAANGSAGGGYGKQSIGRHGGGGYYCPGGGINNSFGGGGIGIWTSDGKTLISSYGSGGNNQGSPPEPGICIIQYYV